MDEVFRALADPTRRSLLDELFAEDGQTLTSLEGRLPMTRFGVMKHLKVLEEAGLVKTKKRGREKLHFLNPVPIRLVHDRWVSKYAEPWAATLSELKSDLEDRVMEKVFEIYIKTTPERLWEAITNSELRQKYTFGVGIESDFKGGSPYKAAHPSGAEISEGLRAKGLIQEMSGWTAFGPASPVKTLNRPMSASGIAEMNGSSSSLAISRTVASEFCTIGLFSGRSPRNWRMNATLMCTSASSRRSPSRSAC